MKFVFTVALTILLISTSFLGFQLWKNLPREREILNLNLNFKQTPPNISAPSDITQFEKNMRFSHTDLTYFISENCNEKQRERMIKAFFILEEKTQILFFLESDYNKKENATIKISCSEEELKKEKNLFVAGGGGPSKFFNTTLYPLILEGKIFLYKSSNCEQPLVELHELLHVFGFEHYDNKNSVMYPLSDCKQELEEEYIDYLKKLYSIPSLADIYFSNISASKAGRYLNFEVEILNQGLISSQVSLEIFADDKKVKSFELNEIQPGEGKVFTVDNLAIPSPNSKDIEFQLFSSSEEYSKENNILRANV